MKIKLTPNIFMVDIITCDVWFMVRLKTKCSTLLKYYIEVSINESIKKI